MDEEAGGQLGESAATTTTTTNMFLSNAVAVAASFLHACVCALFISYTHLFVLDSHQVYLLLFLSLSDLREYSGELLSIV